MDLEELDLNRLTESEIEKVINLLKNEDQNNLKHDLKLAPARISDFVIKNFLNAEVVNTVKIIQDAFNQKS